jgi:polyisoprenoid-binding protein YceI
VSIQPGAHRLGPPSSTLAVRTGRGGAAAKAGHDLLIRVTAWEATIEVGDDPTQTTMELTADATSLRVQVGIGGMQALGDDDLANIHQTIDDEVLERRDIVFRSTGVENGDALKVQGDLTLGSETRAIAFDLIVGADGTLAARAVVTQSAWGMKPYSTLFGALKVADDVEIVLDGHL